MSGTSVPPASQPPSPWAAALTGAGLVYLGLGALLAVVFFFGGIQSSLFPTGWLFPAVLLASGALMTVRRRFDIAITLWAGLTVAVFMLGVLVYVNALSGAGRCGGLRRHHHRGRLRPRTPGAATPLP